jgi:hypothetical protein
VTLQHWGDVEANLIDQAPEVSMRGMVSSGGGSGLVLGQDVGYEGIEFAASKPPAEGGPIPLLQTAGELVDPFLIALHRVGRGVHWPKAEGAQGPQLQPLGFGAWSVSSHNLRQHRAHALGALDGGSVLASDSDWRPETIIPPRQEST